jgi:hypothetical protein
LSKRQRRPTTASKFVLSMFISVPSARQAPRRLLVHASLRYSSNDRA